ncbi:heavy metal translocating P-type ATPase [Nocardia cyriacigeorgica]|uniref:heavy metal translocating P-type ATPase n=1 Tax=Nocardia cyriacigeorgica TaxID=135487 RepID=UPI001895DDB1|nr:heavy metal translocating P-type ATPase [Nocardia cyriacigeorgica]MBF6088304.1 heavy metal translocating P-type ATPase [Nocardia cyriacigeorgica]MBF6095411.1 heavy metal translocating P-type ATPase [Nocardia cyriacigeorgica]
MTSSPLLDRPNAAQSAPRRADRRTAWTLSEVRWAVAATALFVTGLAAHWAGAPDWLVWSLLAGCYATGGWEPALEGLRALRDRTLDVDLLMIVAALGAAAIGQIVDGGLLIVIFATSGALEAVLTHRTAEAVRGLLDLAPDRATLLDGGDERVVDAHTLVPGQLILVRPGERIGGDGVVESGRSEVDQASITGEPLPVPAGPGDEVFAGAINGTGTLRVRVRRAAADTVIARIAAMVREASESKAGTQLFIERVEQWYSTGVVIATLAVLFIPLAAGSALQPALLRAMTFMIVASPCAIVLATMPPLLAAMATASRHGVLVKSAVVMERLGTVDTVAFDKTGTLTEGRPQVSAIRAVTGELDADAMLALAAAAERDSEHPLAAAIVTAARDRGLPRPAVTAFDSRPGRGVRATVEGRVVEVGRPGDLLPASTETDSAAMNAESCVAEWESTGATAVVVTVDGRPAGVLAVTDRPRPAAARAVTDLTALTGHRPVLLTGDNPRAADALAGSLGIVDVRAGVLPEDKVAAVRELVGAGRRVAVFGDGVNDAPALAAAHVGIAMGRTGSDLAVDAADAVVVGDDLGTVAAVVTLSRRARRIVVANLTIAATFIVALVTWDLVGTLPLPLGVAGHEGSTVIVGLNGMRLLADRAWRDALRPGHA